MHQLEQSTPAPRKIAGGYDRGVLESTGGRTYGEVRIMKRKMYFLKVKYIVPKTGHIHTERIGPLYSRKATDSTVTVILNKRNAIGVEVEEVEL